MLVTTSGFSLGSFLLSPLCTLHVLTSQRPQVCLLLVLSSTLLLALQEPHSRSTSHCEHSVAHGLKQLFKFRIYS